MPRDLTPRLPGFSHPGGGTVHEVEVRLLGVTDDVYLLGSDGDSLDTVNDLNEDSQQRALVQCVECRFSEEFLWEDAEAVAELPVWARLAIAEVRKERRDEPLEVPDAV
jgi:hypothetical protein